MTIHAPSHLPDQATMLPAHEHPTVRIEANAQDTILDALPLLDHRSRARAIPIRLASRGSYLAFGDGGETRLIKLDSNITHLGRGLTADLRFEDQRVSRTHAIIVRHGRFARLLDNRSTGGTYVNGRRWVAGNIQNGDVIRIGPVVMQYVEVA
jgi:pSer/pThr/pTyr-binding forkhead associated (FHA) protein